MSTSREVAALCEALKQIERYLVPLTGYSLASLFAKYPNDVEGQLMLPTIARALKHESRSRKN